VAVSCIMRIMANVMYLDASSEDISYCVIYYHQSELVGDVAVPVSVRQSVLF